jgi:pre-60S factor REI1
VRADVFDAKILERKQEEAEGSSRGNNDLCAVCHKTFSSANAYQSHLNSKRHKENIAKSTYTAVKAEALSTDLADSSTYPDPLVVKLGNTSALDTLKNDIGSALPESSTQVHRSTPMALQVAEDATEEEVQAAIDAKIASSRRIDPTRSCIFCSSSGFESLQESLAHMTRVHSFFLPEREYLTDEEGLLRYLSDKICVGNICLYCNGKGRGFASGEAVRKHMVDKSHCKVAYDTEEDKLELSDFYDFRSSYPDAQWEDVSDDGEGADEDAEMVSESEGDASDEADEDGSAPSGVRYGDNEFELILPSGVRLGHRSLRRYYNQSLRPTGSAYAENQSGTSGRQVAHRLANLEKMNQDPTLVENRGGHLVKARNRGEAREAKKHISTYRDAAHREQFKTQVGFKNNSQKHFRDQMLQ